MVKLPDPSLDLYKDLPKVKCKKCGEEYPLHSDFFHRYHEGFKSWCKICKNKENSNYYNFGGGKEYKDQWQKANREKCREYGMRHRLKRKLEKGIERYTNENTKSN